jgi:hypothetical protein
MIAQKKNFHSGHAQEQKKKFISLCETLVGWVHWLFGSTKTGKEKEEG